MKHLLSCVLCSLVALSGVNASAQQQSDIATQIELGAIFTSGNTENESIKYKIGVDWNKQVWDYRFTSEGFRSSQDGISNAQRLYHTARANYTINEISYVQGRLAYENDKFSGFESQSDATVSYGRSLLQNRSTMALELTVGAGIRRSVTETETNNEAIARFAADYDWNLSETADFIQDFSVEAGSDSSIYRSETAIQSAIMENLSMKFSVKVKHQTEVPINREKTDTETSITLVLSF